jgi:hypothetical protein
MHWPHLSLPIFKTPHYSFLAPATSLPNASWSPRTDIRETDNAYIVEIEVPGLKDGQEDEVLVQWMSPRTVIVSGDSKRRTLTTASGGRKDSNSGFVNVESGESPSKKGDEDGGSLKRTASREEEPPLATLPPIPFLIAERHVGYWRRSFTLPQDADFDLDPNTCVEGERLKVRIEAGVLEIQVPRRRNQNAQQAK